MNTLATDRDNESLYTYRIFWFLKEFEDILWENLHYGHIVWIGTQAITLMHPSDPNKILKFSLGEWKDSLVQELQNHKDFYEAYLSWKETWTIDESFSIPRLYEKESDKHMLVIERVDWLSLRSIWLIKAYKRRFDELWIWMTNYTDEQLKQIVRTQFLQSESMIDMMISDYSNDFLIDLLWRSRKHIKSWNEWNTYFARAMKFLEQQWLIHNDLHPWNVMIKNDSEDSVLIDFGRIKKRIRWEIISIAEKTWPIYSSEWV